MKNFILRITLPAWGIKTNTMFFLFTDVIMVVLKSSDNSTNLKEAVKYYEHDELVGLLKPSYNVTVFPSISAVIVPTESFQTEYFNSSPKETN